MSAADLENERLLEQATLAQTFFEIRGQDELQRVLDATVQADEELVKLAQARYEAGTDTEVSVQQAIQTLESARATATSIGIARAAIRARHRDSARQVCDRLHRSCASAPRSTTGNSDRHALATSGAPPRHRRRRTPDGSSQRSDWYRLCGLLSLSDIERQRRIRVHSISKLFNAASRDWSIGPSISETIFDAGLRRATVDQYIATYNSDVANYRQTVLTAFQQVEDYLAETRLLWTEIRQAQAAIEAAQKAYELEKSRYETGLDPYLNLLTTQTALLNTQQTVTELKVQEMASAVLLVEALGGGWDVSQLPTASQVTQRPPADQRTIEK